MERELIEEIRRAFQKVSLGEGVGLFQGQAIDAYKDNPTQLEVREHDEKEGWESIPVEHLNTAFSSLSFFDAEGMRFHLPAYMIGDIKGELGWDPVINLTGVNEQGPLGDYTRNQFVLFSPFQREAVRSYLRWAQHHPNHKFFRPEIEAALQGYWAGDQAPVSS